jgi:uncharacterized membrane protein YvbJ
MQFCQNCGKERRLADKFCAQCGYAFVKHPKEENNDDISFFWIVVD